MRSTHSFSIDFVIRKCKEEKNKAFIYARITVDGSAPVELSTKEKININEWNNKKEIVKGHSMQTKMINKVIDDVRFQLKMHYRTMQEKEMFVTAQKIKDMYIGKHSLQKGKTLNQLTDYFKKIWEQKIEFKNYKTTIDYLARFVEWKFAAKEMYLSQLDKQFMTDFEHYVRNFPIKDHDPCVGNGIAKHIQRFKRMINWAIEIEWMNVNAIKDYKCPLKKSKRQKLTIHLLVVLELKIFKDDVLTYVKDLFLFSCYTGFAFADVMALKASHFEWDTDGTIWCRLYRMKTDELCPVPLVKDAAAIIKKYQNAEKADKEVIFPTMTNQYINRCLKIIQEACEIPMPLTFHIARHTFAKTVALKNGVPLETVQLMLGHTKITTTLIYADVDEEKILDDTSNLAMMLEKKRTVIKDRLLNLSTPTVPPTT